MYKRMLLSSVSYQHSDMLLMKLMSPGYRLPTVSVMHCWHRSATRPRRRQLRASSCGNEICWSIKRTFGPSANSTDRWENTWCPPSTIRLGVAATYCTAHRSSSTGLCQYRFCEWEISAGSVRRDSARRRRWHRLAAREAGDATG